MEFRNCIVCGEVGVLFDMDRVPGLGRLGTRRKHRDCDMYNPPVSDRTEEVKEIQWKDPTVGEGWRRPTDEEMGKAFAAFDRPEDGSQKRYADRVAKRPWLAHTFWWVVHNNIAHPLIGVLPVALAFRFHDWTSRKMHGI